MMAVVANRRSVMTLFSRPTDIHSHRTRLVLAEKNINIEIANVPGPDLPLHERESTGFRLDLESCVGPGRERGGRHDGGPDGAHRPGTGRPSPHGLRLARAAGAGGATCSGSLAAWNILVRG